MTRVTTSTAKCNTKRHATHPNLSLELAPYSHEKKPTCAIHHCAKHNYDAWPGLWRTSKHNDATPALFHETMMQNGNRPHYGGRRIPIKP